MGQLAHSIGDILRIEAKRSGVGQNRDSVSTETSTAADATVYVVNDLNRFYSLKTEWNRLAASSGNPLLQFEWYVSCAEAFFQQGSLYTVVVKRHDEVVAIAPLREVRTGGMKKFEILGSAILCEPCGILFKDMNALETLISSLFDLKKPISTGRLVHSSPEFESFKSAAEKRFSLRAFHTTHSPWLPITTSWDEYQKTISSSKRSSLRRALRRANEHGAVTMEVITPDPDNVQSILDVIYNVEHASWKARAGTSIRSNPYVEKFFNRYAMKMAAAGSLRLSLLKINSSTIAGQIGIEFARKFWVLKVGYDERFSQCSPGILLMHHTIQHAFENGLHAFEFLGRDEQWIRMWTEQVHQYTSYWHYPINTAGLMWLVKDGYTIVSTKINTMLNGKNHDKKN